MSRILAVLALSAIVCYAMPVAQESGTDLITEYLGLAPQLNGPGNGASVIKWTKITYPKGVSSANDVTIQPLNASVPEIGAWYDLDTVNGFKLSGKIIDDKLYAYMNTKGTSSSEGGCCADTIRIFSRADGKYKDVDIATTITAAMPANSSAAASHTFDVEEINGVVYAFAMVRYTSEELGGASADAIVAVSTIDGALLKTADGLSMVNIFKQAGENGSGQDWSAAIFKIQFFTPSSQGFEEWHGNGVQRFTMNDGTNILAITHRAANEAVLMKDPYTYTTATGGGNIMQRFGTPPQYTANSSKNHFFGLKEADLGIFTGGVHNVYHRNESDSFPGKESMSLFVNSAANTGKAYAIEFAINLKTQDPGVQYNDTIFDTEYVASELSFTAQAQGGARAIGNGVILATSGIDGTGLEVADKAGNTHSYAYPTAASQGGMVALYDPFLFVRGT